jgi:hypothetical protein
MLSPSSLAASRRSGSLRHAARLTSLPAAATAFSTLARRARRGTAVATRRTGAPSTLLRSSAGAVAMVAMAAAPAAQRGAGSTRAGAGSEEGAVAAHTATAARRKRLTKGMSREKTG